MGATLLAYILNFYLIAKYDVLGAAYALFIVNFIVGICYIIPNRKYFIKWIFDKRIISIGVITVLTALLFNSVVVINWIMLVFIVVLFIITYFFGLSKNEKEKFSNLVFKKI